MDFLGEKSFLFDSLLVASLGFLIWHKILYVLPEIIITDSFNTAFVQSETSNLLKTLLMIQKMSLLVRKPAFCICKNKDADQLRGLSFAVTAKLISAFVFAIQIVQSLYFLNPKFQASRHFL